MNIVVLSHRVPYPPNKGEKIRTFNQVKFLASLGHDIHLLSPCENDEELRHFASLKKLSICRSVSAFPLSAKPLRLLTGLITGQSLSVANFHTKQLQTALDSFISSHEVDAIICSASSMAEYIFQSDILKSEVKKPLLIMDFMDVDSDKWAQYKRSSHFPMSWIYNREHELVSQFERSVATRFDICYLIAQAEVDLFKENVIDTNNIHVLGNGLDTKVFFPPKVKKINHAPILLFTGVMDYKPNVDAVVWFVDKCWQSFTAKYPEARFIIAGMNPCNDVLALKMMQGIEVTGFVDDILPYYHSADIFIAPFRLARGVQNKVLQAFSCALPVVSTPMGAEGINCTPGKDVLIASDASDFVEKITFLSENKNLAADIGKRALCLIEEQYSWEGQLSPIVDLLTSSVGN
ncbi:TIGR03087 family PEP-CTERM/XrtA system glycosyltransferase [Paraglaciecola sp. L1A13]|uniref:TIGR03087 family PEP-CTERM/XrtA system glycosyltransferase n=1 Tax=Paraglaciecola sp. L1A13 TaxID=2686359 RepID=UPI00131E4909|nr:TIGR03087 family PEP-CTERM/XrtA system glycosyltransferase [Paraglaciecola sp. L1A13]